MPLLLSLAPELLVIVVGVFALLLYLAYELLHKLLAYAIDHWGAIGRFIGGPIDQLLVAAYDSVKGWLSAALHPVVGLFSHPAVSTDAHTKANVSAHVHHQQVAQYTDGRVTYVAQTVGTVQTQLGNLYGDVAGQQNVLASATDSIIALDRIVGAVQAQLAQLYRDVADVNAEINGSAVRGAITGLQQTVGTVQSQLATTVQELAGTNSHVTSVAELASNAYGYTDTQVRTATEAVEDQAARGDAAVRGDVIDGLRIGNPALPLDLTQALAGVAAAAAAATTFVDECGVPMCDWWHGAEKGIGQLLSLFGVAELAALIEAGIHDPGGAAREVASVGPALSGLGSDVLSLFGVS